MKIKWKTIAEHSDVQVSNTGLLRRKSTGKFLSIFYNLEGYARVCIPNENGSGRIRRLVHRLVAEAFIGPCPYPKTGKGRGVCHHIDDNPRNNSVKNLKWITNAMNVTLGHQQRGKGRLITPLRKEILYQRIIQGDRTVAELCTEFGLSPPGIRRHKTTLRKRGLIS